MDRSERERLYSANQGLRRRVDHILDVVEQQQGNSAEVHRQLEALRVQASSSDQLVMATVDATGMVTDVQLTPRAMRGTAEQLGRSLTEAAQDAARLAQEQRAALIAPIATAVEGLPDLPDIVPGAPSLRDIQDVFLEGGERGR